jgi:hypothetical protein
MTDAFAVFGAHAETVRKAIVATVVTCDTFRIDTARFLATVTRNLDRNPYATGDAVSDAAFVSLCVCLKISMVMRNQMDVPCLQDVGWVRLEDA